MVKKLISSDELSNVSGGKGEVTKIFNTAKEYCDEFDDAVGKPKGWLYGRLTSELISGVLNPEEFIEKAKSLLNSVAGTKDLTKATNALNNLFTAIKGFR